jgi:hypothetical protein
MRSLTALLVSIASFAMAHCLSLKITLGICQCTVSTASGNGRPGLPARTIEAKRQSSNMRSDCTGKEYMMGKKGRVFGWVVVLVLATYAGLCEALVMIALVEAATK